MQIMIVIFLFWVQLQKRVLNVPLYDEGKSE